MSESLIEQQWKRFDKNIKMREKLNTEGQSSTHFAKVPDKDLNELIVFGIMILKEATNNCSELFLADNSALVNFLENSLHSMIFVIYVTTKTRTVTFISDSLGKNPCR